MKGIRSSARPRVISAHLAVGAVTALIVGSGSALAAPCQGPGAPTNTQTQCVTAITIPGNPVQSFDISWVNPDRNEYYLGDRSNKGIDIIDTAHNTFKRTIGGFVGIVLNGAKTAVDNNHSGPDGVTSHGRWLYAGDGDSTLHVIDLNAPAGFETKQKLSTGGTTRLDEMALTTDGTLLIAANNAEDPPFATLFKANGDNSSSNVSAITKITVDPTIVPAGAGLSLEQPTWDPKTKRFYTSIPIIANNPAGCNYGQLAGAITCDGGMLVSDPTAPTAVQGAFNASTNTGVVPLHACGPNGITVGVHDNLLLGCTPNNNPSNTTTLVINATTKNYANIGGITGSDEVYFNAGDKRYYTGSSGAIKPASSPLGKGSVLGVINRTSILVETIPQSSGSHSVAADSKHNKIFVPQIWTVPAGTVPAGDLNTTAGAGSATVGQLLCGGTNGCIAVYQHDVDNDDEDNDDRDHDRFSDNDRDHDHDRDGDRR
jgi:hypothetical protein